MPSIQRHMIVFFNAEIDNQEVLSLHSAKHPEIQPRIENKRYAIFKRKFALMCINVLNICTTDFLA